MSTTTVIRSRENPVLKHAGAESIETIPATRFEDLRNLLLAKRRRPVSDVEGAAA